MKKSYILHFLFFLMLSNPSFILSNTQNFNNHNIYDLSPKQKCEANGIDFQQAVNFIKQLQNAIKKNDKLAVAEFGDYPVAINEIDVKKNTIKYLHIKTKEQFVIKYNTIMTDIVKKLLLETNIKDNTFCDNEGVAFNGTIWFWVGSKTGAFYIVNVPSQN